MTFGFRATLFAACGVTALLGCKTLSDGAEVKSGFKTGGIGNGADDSYYQVLPNQSIAICNRGVQASIAQNIKEAVPYWLSPLGRDGYVSVIDGCRGDWIIELRTTTTTPYAWTFGRQGTHTTRIEIGASFVPMFTDRHEMGHVFGFCDLYNPTSCAANTNDPNPSLMGSGNLNGGQMSQGDVDGIGRIIQQKELAASTLAWSKFHEAQRASETVPITDGSVVAGLVPGKDSSSIIFYVTDVADRIEMLGAGTRVWYPATDRYQAAPGFMTVAGVRVGPKNATATSVVVRVRIAGKFKIGTVVVRRSGEAAATGEAAAAGEGVNLTDTPASAGDVAVDTPNAMDNGIARPVLAAETGCVCIRAQEAGCGLSKGGHWLSPKFVEPGLAPCTVDICREQFADIIASACGGQVTLDPQFH